MDIREQGVSTDQVEQPSLLESEVMETPSMEGDDDNDEEDLSGTHRKIFTDPKDPTIETLFSKEQKGRLVLQPAFQRKYVWDAVRASKLVESVLLSIPLPIVYLSEDQDGTQNVIDGQQRLTSLFSFKQGKFPAGGVFKLKGLRARPELNGLQYKDLTPVLQEKIDEYPIRTILFKKESDPGLQFEIFERLNTGSMQLGDQELRNCIYHGSLNELLKELAEDATFKKLLNVKNPESRMWNVEKVLRFIALYDRSYIKYRSPMKTFLNEYMKQERGMSVEKQAMIRKAFNNAVQITLSLFGEHAFRRYYAGTKAKKNGNWEPRKFNLSLFDVCMVLFADADKNRVMNQLDRLREGLIDLMISDDEFITAIERSTGSTSAVQKRFDKWRLRMEETLKDHEVQPRLFTLKLKNDLYAENKTCAICGNSISAIDDAAVDHVEQYWQGGKTIPENARLTHRYCNNARARIE